MHLGVRNQVLPLKGTPSQCLVNSKYSAVMCEQKLVDSHSLLRLSVIFISKRKII